MASGRLRVTVLKGLAATSELLQVEVERDSLVFELMLLLHKSIPLHWRRQRLLYEGQPLEESDRWSQITEEESIDVQMLHCDHRHLNPIDDRPKLHAMVRCCGDALSAASNDLKADKEIVRSAVATTGSALHFACSSLKRDEELVMLAMVKEPDVFRIAGKVLRKDPQLAKRAINANPDNIRYCDADLFKNREFMKYCVQKRPSLLGYAKVTLERSVVLAALEQDGLALECLQEKPRLPWEGEVKGCEDQEFVQTAVRQNGMALAFASKRFRDDVQFASEAVRNDGRAIKFVGSKEVVCQILKERPSALKHAKWEFHDDPEVVEVAYASDPKSLVYAGTEAALEMIKAHGSKILELMKPSIRRNERVLQAVSALQAEELLQGDDPTFAQ